MLTKVTDISRKRPSEHLNCVYYITQRQLLFSTSKDEWLVCPTLQKYCQGVPHAFLQVKLGLYVVLGGIEPRHDVQSKPDHYHKGEYHHP